MKKRGVGNVEFILSFVLFITFVFIAIYFFNPTKDTQTMGTSKYYVFNQIIKNVTIDMNSFSVKTSPKLSGEEIIAVYLPGIPPGEYSRAESYRGQVFPSERSGDIVYVNRGDEQFIIIKFSKEYAGTIVPHRPPNPEKYRIGSSISTQIVSEKNILYLNSSYFKDYQKLKNELAIPDKTDFSFALLFGGNDSIVAENSLPLKTELYTETSRVEVLRKDGTSTFAELRVRIW